MVPVRVVRFGVVATLASTLLVGAVGSATASPADGNPIGNVDLVRRTPGGLLAVGWAIDLDTAEPITVEISRGDAVFPVVADRPRPDVGAAYPESGPNHGFEVTIPAIAGTYDVCATAINVGRGTTNPRFRCWRVSVSHNPFGSVEGIRRAPGGVEVAGWAVDPDSTQSNQVHVHVDGVPTVVQADGSRPDVAAAYPGYGDRHGFQAVVPTHTGRVSTVCVFAINLAPGTSHPRLVCATMDLRGSPIGNLEFAAGVSPSTMAVSGWALDPDVAESIRVHVYVDGVAFANVAATGDRPDVGAAWPGYGAAHGFQLEVAARRDQHVCVYAINRSGPGSNVLMGCRLDPTTGRPPPPGSGVPTFDWSFRPVTPADYGNAWRPGCPVGPASLRYLSVSYWGFDGARRQGGIVVHHAWVPYVAAVFHDLYNTRFQIQRIEPITQYNGPGDDTPDHQNITSGFICRPVTGGSGWSEHSYGWAVDVNPVQNPYVRSGLIVPDPEGRDYLDRTQTSPAMIRPGDVVVQSFARNGWTWGGSWRTLKDYMHFSATGR